MADTFPIDGVEILRHDVLASILPGHQGAATLLLSSSFESVKPPSPALRRLLESKLDTLEKLELVLMLREASTPLREAARHLQVGEEVLRRVVDEVARRGIVEIVGTNDQLRLLASDDELAAIEEAAQIYRDDRPRISALLSAIAFDRIRSMAARSFADAFRLKKKDDDG